MHSLRIICLSILSSIGLIIGGCAHDPLVTKYDLKISQDITPPDRVSDANIGIYYENSSANYIQVTARERSISARDVGRKGVSLLNSVIPKMFNNAVYLDELPPYDVSIANVDGIVEPRMDMAFDENGKSIQLGYTFIFYTAQGVPISTWSIFSEEERLEDQLVDVVQTFAHDFYTSPQTAIFRKYLKDKRMDRIGFDVNDVDVTAHILEKSEQGLNFKELGILPVQITVKNNTGSDITGRGFDVRLIYSNEKRLVPSFPLALVSAIQYHAALGASDSALVAGFLGPLAGQAAWFGSASEQSKARREQAIFFEEARLKETTLTSGESIQGTLYFVLPDDVIELNEATLSLWLLDNSAVNGARKTISLSGINYKISEATKLAYEEITKLFPSAVTNPTRKFTGDLSGTYHVEITREIKVATGAENKYHCFYQKRRFPLELIQDDIYIKGNFLSGKGKINGTTYGGSVSFTFTTSRCPNLKGGQWTSNHDGSSLEGYGWRTANDTVKWVLIKAR